MGLPEKLFSSELRRRRRDADLSLGDLAKLVHYSKGYLSKVENGHKPPATDLARRCDVALSAGGELAALVPRRQSDIDVIDPRDEDEVWVMVLGSDGTSELIPMSRRQALALGLTSALGIGVGRRGRPAADRESTLSGFRTLFDQTRQLGRVASPMIVLPSLVAQTQALRGLALDAAGSARRELLLLAGRTAELAGWMAQESGNDQAAQRWTSTAVDISDAAGDQEMAGYALLRQADITLHRDLATRTIELAQQAQRRPGLSCRVRGLAAQREAQGHALRGDYDACRQSLDRADDLLDEPPSADPAPPLGSSSVMDLRALVAGWCLYDLGRLDDAAEVLDGAIASVPRSAARMRARFGTRQALAHAASGRLEVACEVTRTVLQDAGSVDSATVRLDLRRLARTLARWQNHLSVRELQPHLDAMLRGSDL